MEPDSDSHSTIAPSDDVIEGPSEAVPTTSSHAIDSESVTRNEPTAPSIKAATAAESTGKSDRCKCPPPPSKKEGRNLVVCIDGTANQFSLNNTHVVELYSRLEKNDKQLTYYDSGIGTFVKPSNWLGWFIQLIIHIWDMMVAWNLKRTVLSAYQWLSDVYEPGDRIYLFGFSRGAYQVRIVAGMLERVGLLHRGNNNQIGFAYELYLATIALRSLLSEDGSTESDQRPAKKVSRDDPSYPLKLCKEFKRTLCHDGVRAHFIGAWDTVSSVGITRGPSLPETTTGMSHVCGGCHCISLDERRNKFQPEYVNGGKGPGKDDTNVKEVWFAGSHSDIGGGNAENLESNSFGPPLRWVLYEAMDFGLHVKPFKGAKWKSSEHNPSLVGIWNVLEYYPFRRLSYDTADDKDNEDCRRWPPNLGRGRRVQPGQKLHASVLKFMQDNEEYEPAAELNNGHTWDDVRTWTADSAEGSALIVKDLYSSASDIIAGLHEIVSGPPDAQITRRHTDFLGPLASSSGGGQSIIDVPDAADILLRGLERQHGQSTLASDEKSSLLDALVQALSLFPSLPEGCPRRANSKLKAWLEATSAERRERITDTFGNGPLCGPWNGHSSEVYCVAYSPDSSCVASGSADGTIRLWDAAAGQPIGEPLQGHEDSVYSVAFLPDGKRIVSGSGDNTIRIWDMETHQAVGPPLTGHKGSVTSVKFSPDGKLIASGSDDRTIRIWDAETRHGVGEPLRGHTEWVQSVAFSPYGRRIASCSGEQTVRIWDLETRAMVRVLQGHSLSVWSVVFSPDGRRIVSGSSDDTIRVWDAESGEMVLGPLSRDSGGVLAVAVSPDGRYFVSGSYDRTVRLWDTQTGEAVGEPLRGHTGWVQSVAFSPDSRRVVSGSADNTLMIWDVEI